MSETQRKNLAPKVYARRTELYTSIVLLREVRGKLRLLKKELGFSTYSALLNYLALEATKGAAIPPASPDLIFRRLGTRPVILTGQSGAGKTTAMKELLDSWVGNVFILDVRDEYRGFEAIDLGKIFSLRWAREGQKVRFIPNPNREASQGEASAIFGHLNFVMGSGALKGWLLVIEEGHRFSQDANLRALLIEARKFVGKLAIVTTDWQVYRDIAQVVKPQPWEEPSVPSQSLPEASRPSR